MKNYLLKTALFLSILVSTSALQAQMVGDYNMCVGECGSYFESISFTAGDECFPGTPANYSVNVIENSLCPDHDAWLSVYVNGNYIGFGQLGSGTIAYFTPANCGDQITVVLSIAHNPNSNVVCKRLGNVRVQVTSL